MKLYSNKLKREDRELFELLVGYSCNTSCLFCSLDQEKRAMQSSTKELLSSIFKAKKEGFRYLGIGGGEPTIRKDLPILIKFAKQLNFDIVRIETNGLMLSNFAYCQKLAEAGLDFVKISIHGHNSKIHDALTQVAGSFEKTLQAVNNLHKLNVRVEINTVINKLNYKHYSEFVKFFSNLGVGSYCLIYPLYTGKMKENAKSIGVSMKKVAPFIGKALDLVDEMELDKGIIFNIPPCILPKHIDKIVDLSPFNTKVVSPGQVVESADYTRIQAKIQIEACKKCKYQKDCEGLWHDYVEIFGNSEIEPVLKSVIKKK